MSTSSGPHDPKDPWAYNPSATQPVPATPPTAPNPWDQYPPYQQQQPQYGQYGGTYGPSYNPYPVGGPYQPGVVATTNGKATASLVCAIGSIFFCGPILALPGVLLGVLARREIDRTGGQQGGAGQAMAGIIIGIVVTALWVLFIVGMIVLLNMGEFDHSYNDTGTF